MVSNVTTCNCNKDNNGISNNVITTAEEYHPTSRFCNICRAGIICCKGKAVQLHAMEALGGRGGIAPTHSRPRHYVGVSGQNHAPAALLPPGKEHPLPIVQEAGWASEPVWTQRIEEKSSAPAGDRTPIARSSSP
jgi:hypothetical protein